MLQCAVILAMAFCKWWKLHCRATEVRTAELFLESKLIEYLSRKGASITTMTKAGQTPIDCVSTEEVRALLVKCEQPLTKDDKSTTILEVGDSVSKEHIKENNGGSIAEETANVDEEGVDTKEKRRGEAAADEDSSKPRKAKVGDSVSKEHIKENNGGSVAEEAANVDEEGVDTKEKRREWYGRMESRRIMFSFDVVGPSKCMFRRYGSMVSSSQSDAEVTAKLDGHEGVDVVPSQESSSDSESKPEGRQARKQRKKEAIRARLIVPQPQAVMSLEQTVSEKCLLERRDAIRSKCRGNCRSSSRIEAQGKYLQAIMERAQKSLCFDMNRLSGSLEATRAQLTDFDLPPSGLMGNGQSGLRREELGAEGGAVAGTHQGLGFQLYQEGRGVAEDSSRLLLDLNVKGSSGEMLGGSQNPNAGVGNQLLESDSALAETSDAVMLMISKPCLNVKGSSGEMLGGSQNPNAGVGNQLLESGSALAETSDAVMVRNESMLPTV
ncbi:Ankyrin repeat [Musa troglodytarum]|uniref:Ankyrin repeat n=1 Tax=Musa troglodytarum TaxID=320322 RepID=A0A9E7EN55_9LILI|nr:Ankyrin repeat [Musa troglodytarum]